MSHVTVSLVGIYMPNLTLIFDTNCDGRKSSAKGLQRALAVVFYYLLIIVVVALLWPSRAAAAQGGHSGAGRLLTRDEGLAIVDAISYHHQSLYGKRAKPDCSHLVNDIYDLAGFPYDYAKSGDLYRGHASFVLVSAPQPGDLIVWRGNVGLVVNSRQHLFYSSLRSGLETEDYTSAYWRRRGAPRFYRYRVTKDQTILTARETPSRKDIEGNFRTQLVSQSVNDQLRTNVTSRASNEPLSSSDEASTTRQISNDEELDQTAPSRVLIDVGNKKPTPQQLTEAISKWYQCSSQALNVESLLYSKATVVIFTGLRVEHLEFRGKDGWADVGIDTEATLRSGTLEKTAHHDEQRWELQHGKSGWTVIVPTQNMYVPRASVVRMFAQQLAQLTDQSGSEVAANSASEESHLASLLNTLLNN